MTPEAQLLGWIGADRERILSFLQEFARIDTSNPPGDTRRGAALIGGLLAGEALQFREVAPKPECPNLIATTGGGGRHLVLNGHIDVFPIGDATRWTRAPLGGERADGRIWGRGTVDMKAGTTASLFAYVYLSRLLRDRDTRLTLTAVSDEETGGRWGAGYLTREMPGEVLGDCLLNAEPSSPGTIRFGEKAVLWLTVEIRTPGGHGAYPHLSPSATRIAAKLIERLAEIESVQAKVPPHVIALLARPEAIAAYDKGLGPGSADVAQRVTLNVGTLHGGVSINMLPGACDVGLDIRLPPGIAPEAMIAEVERVCASFPEARVIAPEVLPLDPTLSDPDHPMMGLLQDAAEELQSFRPVPVISLGGTDCRFWRRAGIPAFVYGPSPEGMAGIDEGVRIEEFLHVLKTHMLAAWRWLDGQAPSGRR